MTTEHLKNILTSYNRYLVNNGFTSIQKADDIEYPALGNSHLVLCHCLWMCEQSLQFIEEGDRDKAMRWLCFIQGCFWMTYQFTIEQMREHSRPPERGGRLP